MQDKQQIIQEMIYLTTIFPPNQKEKRPPYESYEKISMIKNLALSIGYNIMSGYFKKTPIAIINPTLKGSCIEGNFKVECLGEFGAIKKCVEWIVKKELSNE